MNDAPNTTAEAGLESFISLSLAEVTPNSALTCEWYRREGEEMVLVEQGTVPALEGLLKLGEAISSPSARHGHDADVSESAGRPVAVALAEPTRFKHYVGISPARARRLHRQEGFPLRVRGGGARRCYYAVLDEVEEWWKKQAAE